MLTVTFYGGREFAFHQAKLKKLVRTICRRFNLAEAKISIAIVGNKQIRKLNEKFLHRKTATDCIAFDLSDLGGGRKLFELVVNGQRAGSEAEKRGHSALAELALYITHGLLHLLGLNDLAPSQAKKMHRIEDEILQQQGFGLVYDNKRNLVSKKQRQKC
ncbi:MAG: rRNA maturation RNase YbeY [Sedimentisphaerales bacterium]|nr:rRNA maturation RNase YbeY [Sedimentisphaerales bacterium]